VSEGALRSYLKNLPSKYGASLDPSGPDVLTIDDSTKGAGWAAALARECGHQVFLFINPHQISTGEPYYFSLFDACLDNRRESKIMYHDIEYDLNTQVRTFRLAAKRVLSNLDHDNAREVVVKIGEMLNCASYEIPEHAQPLTLTELLHLRDVGVIIENHGWSHRCIDSLSTAELKQDILATQNWLLRHVGTRSVQYALPFGETILPLNSIEGLGDVVLLADNRYAPGLVRKSIWNRVDISRWLQSLK
jgi:hypothetical protein